jgi:hypothetical protein
MNFWNYLNKSWIRESVISALGQKSGPQTMPDRPLDRLTSQIKEDIEFQIGLVVKLNPEKFS